MILGEKRPGWSHRTTVNRRVHHGKYRRRPPDAQYSPRPLRQIRGICGVPAHANCRTPMARRCWRSPTTCAESRRKVDRLDEGPIERRTCQPVNETPPISRGFSQVGAGGFEPPKAEPTDLQSVPFDRFGTRPIPRGAIGSRPEDGPFIIGNGRPVGKLFGVAQVELEIGRVGVGAVELDVVLHVLLEHMAAFPRALVDRDALGVEEDEARVDVQLDDGR